MSYERFLLLPSHPLVQNSFLKVKLTIESSLEFICFELLILKVSVLSFPCFKA